MQLQYVDLMDAMGQPAGHAEAWRWLGDRITNYPHDRRYWPWKRATRKDRRRPIAMVGGSPAVRTNDTTARIAALHILTPAGFTVVTDPEPIDMARASATALFGPHTRATSLVVADGSKWLLESILAHLVPTWVADGYVITPILGGHVMRGIVVRQGRYRWTLADIHAMTGSTADELADTLAPGPGPATVEEAHLAGLTRAVEAIQSVSLSTFGVYLRPTVSGTAMRAAGYHVPDGTLIPRPPPWVVTMARVGRAYRGGYVFAEPYRGPAYKVDARRLYARALMEPLPTLWAMGHGIRDGREQVGMFMCTVSGTALHPVTLPVWSGPELGFVVRPWADEVGIALLPSTEYRGLRAMGLTVTPGWGWVGTHPIALRTFIGRLQGLLREHGSAGAVGRMAKLLGNTLYGRLAVNPRREDLVYATDQPRGNSWPVVRMTGEVVDNLWTVESERYAPGQQVGMATLITGWARSHLYEHMAGTIKAGRRIVHAHTDGYVATGSPPDDLPTRTDTIGDWRLEHWDTDAIVARAGGYHIAGETKWSGAPHEGRRTVELAYGSAGWLLQGQQVVALGR